MDAPATLIPSRGDAPETTPLIYQRSYVPPEPYVGWAEEILRAAWEGVPTPHDPRSDAAATRNVWTGIGKHLRQRWEGMLHQAIVRSPEAAPLHLPRNIVSEPAWKRARTAVLSAESRAPIERAIAAALEKYPLHAYLMDAYEPYKIFQVNVKSIARYIESMDRQLRRVVRDPLAMEVLRTKLALVQLREPAKKSRPPTVLLVARARVDYLRGRGIAVLNLFLPLATRANQVLGPPEVDIAVYSERLASMVAPPHYRPLVKLFRISGGGADDLPSAIMEYVFRYDIVMFYTTGAAVYTADPGFIDRLFNPTKQVV